jgi:AraC family transcriptional regulator
MRATFLFIDPAGPLLDAEVRFNQTIFRPRLFFEDPILFATARKLEALIEAGEPHNRFYAEALGIVLSHELMRLDAVAQIDRHTRGGLAGWQKKRVSDYIHENLSTQISLTALADLAQLSPYHFSRAFKQSFGLPPLRYHARGRIERAKSLLADAGQSITEIALKAGFGDASSFTRVFHKFTGRTPSEYRRSIV